MTPQNSSNTSRSLKTVSTAARVLEVLKHDDGVGVTELANRLDVPKSTAYTQLKTLAENGLVRKDGSDYVLGLKLVSYGEYVREQSTLYRHGKSQVDELAEETNQYTHIVTEDGGRAVNLYQVRGDTSVDGPYQKNKLQEPDSLHYTAAGKAILAHLPEERVRHIVDAHGLPRRTENTVTDRERLFEELAAVRERGYAYNDEEEIEGFRAIGAPIQNDDEVLGSISVSGPTSWFHEERFRRTLPERIIKATNIIEVNINMRD
jgi:DNA-binding IclR family transcriptional regulator